jgi:hypothetical protein
VHIAIVAMSAAPLWLGAAEPERGPGAPKGHLTTHTPLEQP